MIVATGLTLFLACAWGSPPDGLGKEARALIAEGRADRALEIVERAQRIDPDNEALAEAIVAIGDKRYVNEERFTSVEKGMSQAEVEAILGRVFHRNVREYEEQGALAWFYPKDPEVGGGAAAVFFKKNKADSWVVYQMDFSIEPDE